MFNRIQIAFLCVAGMCCGCDDQPNYGSLGLVPVGGRVTLDGLPLAGVTVRFEGADRRFADGVTDANGKYTLMYDSDQAGCLPGDKVVRILPHAGEGEETDPDARPDGKVTPPASRIPTAYNERSSLTANVSDTNRTFDFELSSNR